MDLENGRVPHSVGDESDLGHVVGHAGLLDDQRVLALGLPQAVAPALLQLGAVEEPGARQGGGQLQREAGLLAFGHLAALQPLADLGPRNWRCEGVKLS